MKLRLLDPTAPLTVRLAALLIAGLSVFDFGHTMIAMWFLDSADVGVWEGFIWPVLLLSLGLVWAWGIATMIGVYYWLIVTLSGTVILGLVIAMFVGALIGKWPPEEGVHWDWPEDPDTLVSLLILALLFSKPSIRAFWNRGKPTRPDNMSA